MVNKVKTFKEISKLYEPIINKIVNKCLEKKDGYSVMLNFSMNTSKEYFHKNKFDIRATIFEESLINDDDIFYRFGFILKQENRYFIGWIIIAKVFNEDENFIPHKINIENEVMIVNGLIPSEENWRRFLKREVLRRREIVMRIKEFEKYNKF